MRVLDNLFGSIGSAIASYQRAINVQQPQNLTRPPFFGAWADSEKWKGGTINGELEYAERRALQNSWLYMAIGAVSREASGAKFSVVIENPNEEAGYLDVKNHPFEVVMRRPNSEMGKTFLWDYTITWLELDGNAYWFLGVDNERKIREIWPLPSHQVQVFPGDRRRFVDHYKFNVNGRVYEIPSELICHFKYPNPFDIYRGLSPLVASMLPIDSDTAMSKWNGAFFGHDNVMPSAIINLSSGDPDAPIDPDDADRLVADLKENYSMMHRRTIVTTAQALQVQMLGYSQRDMDFLSGRTFTKEEIFGIYGVPAGLFDKNATEANAQVADRTFKEKKIYPTLLLLSEQITSQIVVPYYGIEYSSKFEDVRPTNRAQELAEIQSAKGALTIDEIRSKYFKLQPLPDEIGKAIFTGTAPAAGGDGSDDGQQTQDGSAEGGIPQLPQPTAENKPVVNKPVDKASANKQASEAATPTKPADTPKVTPDEPANTGKSIVLDTQPHKRNETEILREDYGLNDTQIKSLLTMKRSLNYLSKAKKSFPNHLGRPGLRGGSLPKGGGISIDNDTSDFPYDLGKLTHVSGTEQLVLQDDSTGKKYIQRYPGSTEHGEAMVDANNMYRAMGVRVPKIKQYGDTLLIEHVEGRTLDDIVKEGNPETIRKAYESIQKDFGADALVGNTLVVGGLERNNIIIDKDGNAWRMQHEESFNHNYSDILTNNERISQYPTELWELRKPTASEVVQQNTLAFGDIDYPSMLSHCENIVAKRESILSNISPFLKDTVSKRIDAMEDIVKTSKILMDDKFKPEYVEEFMYHSVNLRKAGLLEHLSKKMVQLEDSYYMVDTEKQPFDTFRNPAKDGKTATEFLFNYVENNYGTDSKNRLSESIGMWAGNSFSYTNGRQGDAYSLQVIAGKYMRNISTENHYMSEFKAEGIMYELHPDYSVDKIKETVASMSTLDRYNLWDDKAKSMLPSVTALHAFTFESLRHMEIPGSDMENGTMKLFRNEPYGTEKLLGDTAFKGKSIPKLRGALASYSPYYDFGLHKQTSQNVPYHRILATYFMHANYSRSQTVLYSDQENEFITMGDGIKFDYIPKVSGDDRIHNYSTNTQPTKWKKLRY